MSDILDLDDMLDTYLYENRQLLEQLQELILAQKGASQLGQTTIHKIFRIMHTMKGSSGIMMFDSITKVSHKVEDVFAVIRESQPEYVPHAMLIEYILEVSDFLSTELDKVETGKAVDGDTTEIISKLDKLLEQIKKKSNRAERESYVTQSVSQKYYIAPVANTEQAPFFIDLESSVEEIEARAERTQEQIMEEAKTKALEPGDFVIRKYIQVDMAKLDKLVEIVDILFEAQEAVINQQDNYEDAVKQMRELSLDLKSVIKSIRKVSLSNVFLKMQRIVFDASRKLGKDIELVITGEGTEVDKSIAEMISDPVMHLIRNAVDHGIELPEDRVLAGKSERGKILLSAHTDCENVWIVIEDDGCGLNKEKIFEKAQKQGIIDSSNKVFDFTDEEIFSWITRPGFSTKEDVSEYSGRGVGMDVVASNLALLNGNLKIESTEGFGSKITLQIPIIRCLEA